MSDSDLRALERGDDRDAYLSALLRTGWRPSLGRGWFYQWDAHARAFAARVTASLARSSRVLSIPTGVTHGWSGNGVKVRPGAVMATLPLQREITFNYGGGSSERP